MPRAPARCAKMEQSHMGIREALNHRTRLAIGLSALLVVAGVGLCLWASSSGIPASIKTAYYSDDDGRSTFVDEVDKLVPFDHGGKQAVRAFVYRCGSGKPFVGYLTR